MLSHSGLSFSLFLLFTLFIHRPLAATRRQCHPDDENGLLAFKSGIKSDPSGMLNSWKPGTDCCRWAWVSCSPESNRITVVDLEGWATEGKNILSGSISPSLSKLQYLESLVLKDLGNMTGPLPDFLFATPNISSIIIINTKLSGRIPRSIGNLTKLETLVLGGNQFSGPIPSLAKLTGLVELDLSSNRFTGSIPGSFKRLHKLFRLDLSRNQFSGSIPDIFSRFTFLKVVHLSDNNFSGSIPKSLSNLDAIVINLGHNTRFSREIQLAERTESLMEPAFWGCAKKFRIFWGYLYS